NFLFSVYGEDKNKLRSGVLTFPVTLTAGVTVDVTGIFISPTLDVDKEYVKKGNTITFFGQTSPASDVTITVNSEQEFFVRSKADTQGVYLHQFDSSVLELGDHHAKSKSIAGAEISPYSNTVAFKVGDKDIPKENKICTKGDLNNDCRVNLVDFSIAAYWYKRPLAGEIIPKEVERLNGDGKIDLVDFSIMAYYWTG
nr:dockerin type I repeat-containing protein [bacterium]